MINTSRVCRAIVVHIKLNNSMYFEINSKKKKKDHEIYKLTSFLMLAHGHAYNLLVLLIFQNYTER